MIHILKKLRSRLDKDFQLSRNGKSFILGYHAACLFSGQYTVGDKTDITDEDIKLLSDTFNKLTESN